MNGDQMLAHARAGLFRSLSDAEREKFERAGRMSYADCEGGIPVEINPIHHPAYRLGLAQAAAAHAQMELEWLRANRPEDAHEAASAE